MYPDIRQKDRVKVTGILIFLLISLILPDYFQQLGIVTDLFTLITGIIFFYLVAITLFKREFNTFVTVSFLFIIWRSFSSYYFSNEVLDIVNSFRILTLLLLINLSIKRFPNSTLKALSIVFSFYIILNLVSYIIIPQGLYVVEGGQLAWILGIENQFGYFLIPGITLIVLYSWYKYKKLSSFTLILTLLVLVTLLKAWSATAIVAMFFVLISLFINLRRSIKPLYSFFRLSIIYTIIWVIIVRLNSISFFETIITDILGKDLTLSGRTRIWDAVFMAIPISMWYGFGINTEVLGGVVTYFAAHNMLLQVILDTGLIGLILFIISIIIAGIKLQGISQHRISIILLIGIFGILIGGLTESYRINFLFLLLTISYNVKHLIKDDPTGR